MAKKREHRSLMPLHRNMDGDTKRITFQRNDGTTIVSNKEKKSMLNKITKKVTKK